MNINVHIERLILEGLPVSSHDAAVVRAAVQAELSRLLAEHGVEAPSHAASELPHLSAGLIHLTHDVRPITVGDQIARVVHKGISNAGVPALADKAILQSSGARR